MSNFFIRPLAPLSAANSQFQSSRHVRQVHTSRYGSLNRSKTGGKIRNQGLDQLAVTTFWSGFGAIRRAEDPHIVLWFGSVSYRYPRLSYHQIRVQLTTAASDT